MRRFVTAALLVGLSGVGVVVAADRPAPDKPAADKPATEKPAGDKSASDKPAGGKPVKVDFVKQIKPLLEANCAKCHGVRPTKAYSLLTKEQAFTPGESEQPPILPGQGAGSLIVVLMKAKDPEGRMPQKKPAMKPQEIALIERWIDEGAGWPDNVKLTPPPEEKE